MDLASTASIISMSNQYIVVSSDSYALIFVHAKNYYLRRCSLWLDIRGLPINGVCIIGDFNIVLGTHGRIPNSSYHRLSAKGFKEFVDSMGLYDIEATRNDFTWSTRHNSELISVWLDLVLANQDFLTRWSDVELMVLPRLCSDHSPLRLVTKVGAPCSSSVSFPQYVVSS